MLEVNWSIIGFALLQTLKDNRVTFKVYLKLINPKYLNNLHNRKDNFYKMTEINIPRKTALLMILDGWGHRENPKNNAIQAANTPTWDALVQTSPNTLIKTSGNAVGLPEGQMGNSEVGHMNIGAGRVVYQNLSKIDRDISSGSFFENQALLTAIDETIKNNSTLHILGLLSPGGIHSHENHISALIDLAIKKKAPNVRIHAFLDGRDTPPRSALQSLISVTKKLSSTNSGEIASISGRFFAMDRDNRWDRVEPVYNMLTTGEAIFRFETAETALKEAYARGEDDEFIQPSLICNEKNPATPIQENDSVIFMNFRSDRARQLTRAFTDNQFSGFSRRVQPRLASFTTLTQYASTIDSSIAYPPEILKNCLGEILSSAGKNQLRIAETEKYAHVTFFFNGGIEEKFQNEDRILVPSPNVKTYDLKPEMSAIEVTDKLIQAIESGEYDTIICNYANGDMVGHTGNFNAAIEAVEVLDHCMSRVLEAIKSTNGEMLITADHGNVEKMRDTDSNQPLTSHTSGPVPLVYVGQSGKCFSSEGSLCDIAPTLLAILGLTQPKEMSGVNLLDKPYEK